ncbi:MAG: ABC transporter substrate-binding protein [Pseudomonadota bacterium]
MASGTPLQAADKIEIRTGLLRVAEERPLPISRVDLPPEDLGTAGGTLAVADNNTTGSFLGQVYSMDVVDTPPAEAVAAAEAMLADGITIITVMGSAETVLAIADLPGAKDALILNATATDDRLRNDACRANVLHTAPSRAMIADGLAQYMIWKKWDAWLLVHGSNPADGLKADAYRNAAKKFGAEIVEDLVFEDTGGARRSDSGHVLVQKQIPVFMQEADDHDVVVAADESGVFGVYLPYRGWVARPVVGDAGLTASLWHPGHESYGSTQLQRRFEKLAGRQMRDEDFTVWTAIRAIGEAVTRTNSGETATLREYLLGEEFKLATFKGQPTSFRPWNGQFRHGVILGDAKLVVSISPQEEFLHQRTRLDTLGFDEPQSTCRAF